MPISGQKDANQVAIVVRDLDASMARYVDKLGIGPWKVYTYGPEMLHSMTYRGEPASYVMELAIAFTGDTMWELIESVEGPNIYEEFLNEHGEGLHHLGYYVGDLDKEIATMAALGYPLLQSGKGFGVENDGGYAYFDTAADLGCIIEAIEPGTEFREPERVFPE